MRIFKLYCKLIFLILLISISRKAKAEDLNKNIQSQPEIMMISPISKEDINILEQGLISNERKWGALIIGYYMGFGTGHMLIHKYDELGWFFTISDVASTTLLTSGLLLLTKGQRSSTSRNIGSGLVVGSISSLALTRVWQLYDIWTRSKKHNTRFKELESNSTISWKFYPQISTEKTLSYQLQMKF